MYMLAIDCKYFYNDSTKGVDSMSTSPVYARIDTELKENAESILSKLGITPSSAIQMLYSQIVLTNSLPLDLRLPVSKPTSIGDMTSDQSDAELRKGLNSLQKERTYTPEEVHAILAKEFSI